MDDIAPLCFQRFCLHQHFEGGLGTETRHALCEAKFMAPGHQREISIIRAVAQLVLAFYVESIIGTRLSSPREARLAFHHCRCRSVRCRARGAHRLDLETKTLTARRALLFSPGRAGGAVVPSLRRKMARSSAGRCRRERHARRRRPRRGCHGDGTQVLWKRRRSAAVTLVFASG